MREYFKPHSWTLAVIFIGIIVSNLFTYLLPLGLKWMIDEPNVSATRVLQIGVVLLLALLAKVIIQWRSRKGAARISEEVGRKLSHEVYSNAMGMHVLDLRRIQPAQVVQLLSQDIEAVKRFGANEMLEGLYAFISIIIAAVFLSFMSLPLMVFALAAVGCAIVFLCMQMPQLRGDFAALKNLRAQAFGRVNEILNAAAVVRMLGLRKKEIDIFDQSLCQVQNISLKSYGQSMRLMGMVDVFVGFVLVVLLMVGGISRSPWHLSPGTLAAFYSFVLMLFVPLMRLGSLLSGYHQARSSWERIENFLKQRSLNVISNDKSPIQQVSGQLEVRAVSYAYEPGRPVLDNISFMVSPGKTLAVVGPSGAGKTTLVCLISGIISPSKGGIYLDGVPLSSYSPEDLSDHLAVVFQDDVLFSGTILSNLTYGNEMVDMDAVIRSCRSAGAHDFIMAQPKGYHTAIVERGLTLSGGQRQRIALARAMLRSPKVLILDEATCALDALTENAVQRAIRSMCPQSAIITIAHRFSSIMDADEILVLDQGKVSDQGDHNYLLSKPGLYSTLYNEQFRNL